MLRMTWQASSVRPNLGGAVHPIRNILFVSTRRNNAAMLPELQRARARAVPWRCHVQECSGAQRGGGAQRHAVRAHQRALALHRLGETLAGKVVDGNAQTSTALIRSAHGILGIGTDG